MSEEITSVQSIAPLEAPQSASDQADDGAKGSCENVSPIGKISIPKSIKTISVFCLTTSTRTRLNELLKWLEYHSRCLDDKDQKSLYECVDAIRRESSKTEPDKLLMHFALKTLMSIEGDATLTRVVEEVEQYMQRATFL